MIYVHLCSQLTFALCVVMGKAYTCAIFFKMCGMMRLPFHLSRSLIWWTLYWGLPIFSFPFYIDGHVFLWIIHPCISIFYIHRPFMGVTHPFLSFPFLFTSMDMFYWGHPFFLTYIHGHVFGELTILFPLFASPWHYFSEKL